jgi:hypothetical protein
MGLILDVILEFVTEIFHIGLDDRRGRKHQQSGQIDCGLRMIVGSHEGLTSGWRNGRAFVDFERLEFGRRNPISVPVRAVVAERQRHPRKREAWLRLLPTYQIVELMTDSATLEWAVPEDKLEWALARLRGSEISYA